MNFQSGPDPNVDARLLLYNAAFHLRFHVPVRSILVLLRPKAATAGLNANLTYVSGGKRVSFEYDVIRLWKEPVQPFLEGGLSLLPLAMLCKMPTGKSLDQSLREVVRAIESRLASEPNYSHAVRLTTGAFILTGLRLPKERVSALYEGVRIMHETVAWDQYIDEGRVRTGQRALLNQGRQLFGEPSPKVEAALTSIQDPDRLDRMLDFILTLKSWRALLAVK